MMFLALLAAAFVVRAAVGLSFAGPAYPDSYYYVHVAQQLAAGHGFTADYIWNFVDVGGRLPAVPTLPIPSNAHWMPLAAVIQVPFIWLFGPTALASGLPFWIVGALAAPLTYLIGRDSGFARSQSVAAGLLVAVPGGLTPYLSQPDNFGLFLTLGALSLWLCARAMRGDNRALILGGLVVGLATLARSDGVLLGIPLALVALWQLARGPGRRTAFLAGAGCFVIFVLVMAPWLYRQVEVFGSIAPSASSGRILWITQYSELYSIGPTPGPDSFFGQGLGAVVASRVGGLLSALGLFAFLPLVVVLTPFALFGAWVHRRDRNFTPFFIYATALFAASALLFAVHVPYGTFIHSAVALLPHTFLLVVAGVGAAVGWVARRRPSWDMRRATAVFTYGAVAVAVCVAALQTVATVRTWSGVRDVETRLAASLSAAPVTDRIMSGDAGAYNYLTGHPGIIMPNDPLPVIEDAMRAYDVRWLILEQTEIVPALQPVLNGTVTPAWLSAPVAIVAAPGAVIASVTAVPGQPPDGALYAVCFSPNDTRCTR